MSRELIEAGLSGWSWDPDRVARAIQARDTLVLVAEIQDYLTGFAIMNFGDTQAHLSLLAVIPTHQRCGIARQMMSWLDESALAAGIETINLELRAINEAARSFYRALGFKETAYLPGYYRGVETALRMSRDIRRHISDRIN
ncbi:MAG: GNAT family N-acetyltransferase [Betaproteobacteria bacterium]|nr:GNAT family N-acetyltransferase [Betaproteobacteria bacterium]